MNDPVADPGFSDGGAQIPKLGLFCKFFADCVKMKEFGPPGGASLMSPLGPPMESVSVPVCAMIRHTARGFFTKVTNSLFAPYS